MTEKELARQLRDRLQIRTLVPTDVLSQKTDREIILSYVTCSCCGRMEVKESELPAIIKHSSTAVDFFGHLDALRRARRGR